MFKLVNFSNQKLLSLDSEDVWAARYRWHVGSKGAYRFEKGSQVYLSMEIGKLMYPEEPKLLIELKDGNLYNYLRSNLRLIYFNSEQLKRSQNSTSAYRGVSWSKRRKKWCVQFTFNGTRVCQEYYDFELMAAIRYNEIARQYLGSEAKLNEILI